MVWDVKLRVRPRELRVAEWSGWSSWSFIYAPNEDHYRGKLNPERYRVLRTHWLLTSGCSILRVEFEAAGITYYARETSPNLLLRNFVYWMQQQVMEHCSTYFYFSKRFYRQLSRSTRSVQQDASAIVVFPALFQLRVFIVRYGQFLWYFPLHCCSWVRINASSFGSVVYLCS